MHADDGSNSTESIVLENQWRWLKPARENSWESSVESITPSLDQRAPHFNHQKKVGSFWQFIYYVNSNTNGPRHLFIVYYLLYLLYVTKRVDTANKSSDMLSRSKLTSPTSLQCWWCVGKADNLLGQWVGIRVNIFQEEREPFYNPCLL